jgi:hypothetical protein
MWASSAVPEGLGYGHEKGRQLALGREGRAPPLMFLELPPLFPLSASPPWGLTGVPPLLGQLRGL